MSTIATTGVPYFIENYTSIPMDTYKIHYTFLNGISSGINRVGEFNSINQYPSHSGVFLNTIIESSLSGESGYCSISNNALIIQNTSSGLFSGNDFSFSILTQGGHGPLFSNAKMDNFSGEYLNLGFSFGINKANLLYFEYFDKDGPRNYTFNNPLSDFNSLIVSVNGDNLTLGYYDFFQNQEISQNFHLNSQYLFPTNDNWLIGSRSGISGDILSDYKPSTFFSGKIDEFIFFNKSIDSSDWIFINSGFAFNHINEDLISGYISVNEITGYQTGIVGISTGITGYSIIETGIITDEFGNSFSGTSITPLTGIETGLGIIPMSGLVQYPIVTGHNSYLSGDPLFIQSFGKIGINLFSEKDPLDSLSWNIYSGLWSGDSSELTLNNEAVFDRAKGIFNLPSISSSNKDVCLFLNGVFQTSGNPTYSGNIYSSSLVLSEDYFISGKWVHSSGFFKNSDYLNYDLIPSHSLSIFSGFSHQSGTGNSIIPSQSNDLIFFNGHKIYSFISGQNPNDTYLASGSSCIFSNDSSLFNGITGVLSIVSNLPSGFIELRSNSSFCLFDSKTLSPKTSMGFLNGVRLSEDDFIEFSQHDLLSGNSSLVPMGNLIYNNNKLFFE